MSENPEDISRERQQHEREKELFNEALDLNTGQRSQFIRDVCNGQSELGDKLRDLLRHSDEDLPVLGPLPVFVKGQLIGGRFDILELVGEGGMGLVYKALDRGIAVSGRVAKPIVALKTIRADLAGDAAAQGRFLQELVLSRSVGHPNVCRVFDIGSHEEQGYAPVPFISMEFLGGETLASFLNRERPNRKLTLDLLCQLFDGLSEIHARRIIHRDLKPANIHLVPEILEGQEKLRLVVTDFGLARSLGPPGHAVTRVLAGTPRYSAPEQFETGECSVKTDIYSLGVIAFEMFTGQKYQDAVNASAVLRSEAPEFARIILRCVEHDPGKRPENVQQVAEILRHPRRLKIVSFIRRGTVALTATAVIGFSVWLLVAVSGAPVAVISAERTQVTVDEGLTAEPAASADGKRIVYSSDGGLSGVLSIWRKDLPAGTPIRLTKEDAHATTPAISPDGRFVFYRSERDGGGIYRVSADGGPETKLVSDGRHPIISPDGKLVLYWTGQEGDYSTPGARVWLMNENGVSQQLFADFADARFPVWGPGGNRILFRGSRDGSVQWNQSTDWWTGSVHGGAPIATKAYAALFKAKVTPFDTRIFWTNDGVLFGGRIGHTTNLWKLPMSSMGRLLGEPYRLTGGRDTETSPWLLPDGSVMYADRSAMGHVFQIPLKGGGPAKQITFNITMNTRPSVSTDAGTVVFTRRQGEARNVVVLNPMTKATRELLKDQPAIPFVSPDGSRIAYSLPMDSRNPIHLLKADGSSQVELCGDCGEVAGWSFDGRYVLFLTGTSGAVKGVSSIDVQTRALRPLIEPVAGLTDVSVSRDGATLALAIRPDATHSIIYVASVPDKRPIAPSAWVRVTDGSAWADHPRWSPSDDGLFFLSEADGFICVWKTDTPRSGNTKLNASPFYHNHEGRHDLHQLSRPAQGLAVSRDAIFLNVPVISGNIWLLRTRESQKDPFFFLRRFLLKDALTSSILFQAPGR